MGIQLRFAHCNSFVHATAGKKLPAGTSFATTGSTGRSTGPHIHLEADTVRGQMRYVVIKTCSICFFNQTYNCKKKVKKQQQI